LTDFSPPQFPCERLPENPAHARLLGIYPQRSAGPDALFMQRVKAPAGRLTLEQWQGLAELVARYTPDYPLHVTTRQNLELHGLREKDLPAAQRDIASLGLTGAAACGDAVRNITVCPRNGCCPGTWDVEDVVRAIRSAVESLPWRTSLPRKFKISVSGCHEACARPWINDVGLTANRDGAFRAILAGSLGGKPDLGILVFDALPLEDVLPLVIAALRLFHAEGDRTHRARARLRHVRQRLGEAVFHSRVEELLQEERQKRHWPAPALRLVEGETPLRQRLHLPLGDIAPDAVLELVEAVRAADGEVRLGICHDLLLFAKTEPVLAPRLTALYDESVVVTCPGSTWCMRGIVDSRAAAGRIGSKLPKGCGLLVAISGCPNNCSQAAVADIGLVGRMLRRDGREHVEGYKLYAGGGKGETPALAKELHPGFPAETVDEAVAWLAEEYRRAQASRPLSFADFVAASGEAPRDELARRYGHWSSGF
jgi:sulfite reductase beta subunit-like hemoprotein